MRVKATFFGYNRAANAHSIDIMVGRSSAIAVIIALAVILIAVAASRHGYRLGHAECMTTWKKATERAYGRASCPSTDGYISPEQWGPWAWSHFYSVASNYCKNLSEAYRQYFNLIPHIIPCPECGKKFAELLKKRPVEGFLDSREQLLKWVWLQHSDVRKHQRVKTIPDFSLADVYRRYLSPDEQPTAGR
jgi:hypothetical protein